MFKQRVKTPEQALVYLVDCTLATVEDLAMKKSRPKGEYRRQIKIAQTGIDWIKEMNIECDSRPKKVIDDHNGSVQSLADFYDITLKDS